MFTPRFPVALTWFGLWGFDTFPQTPMGSIHSRRDVARHPKTDIIVEVVGLVAVAGGDAGVPLIVVPRAAPQRFWLNPGLIINGQ